jgi:hypothetical protein
MAACFSSEESDFEDFVPQASQIVPYQFEPVRDVLPVILSEDDSSDASSDSSTGEDRRENVNWCTCGKCNNALLLRPKEYLCCRERVNTRSKAQACELGKFIRHVYTVKPVL